MQQMLKSDLVKVLSTIFLFCLVMAALAVAIYDTLVGLPINPTVSGILVAAITATLPIVGVHQGITIANGVAEKTVQATLAASKEQRTNGSS